MQALIMCANGLSHFLTKQWSRLHSTDLYANFVFRNSNTDRAVLLHILLANFLDGYSAVVEKPLLLIPCNVIMLYESDMTLDV
jgi:hypothetical protein